MGMGGNLSQELVLSPLQLQLGYGEGDHKTHQRN